MEFSARSRLQLALGAGVFLTGGLTGWLLRGDAPSPSGQHELANPPKQSAASGESSGAAPVRVAAAAPEEIGGRVMAESVDFVAEARGAMSEVDEWDRLRRLHGIIDHIEPADLEAAAAQVRLLPAGERWTVAWVLGERWAHFAPLAALAYGKKTGLGENGRAIIDGAFQKWMAEAPDDAVAWALALPKGKTRDSLVAYSISGIAITDPRHAAELLKTELTGESQENAASSVGANWADCDPAAAATFRRYANDSIQSTLGGPRPHNAEISCKSS